MDEFCRAIVIGGGITGLTVAHYLDEQGIDVRVFERDASVGGTMTTIHNDGWLIERGPNSALETTPLFKDLFSRLGISDQVLYANECSNTRYIVRNGKLHSLPMSPPAFLKSRLWSTGGKLRLLKEPFVPRASAEESVASFVTRRLGSEFLDYAINPFVAGVFAGDPAKLSVRSAFPKLYALEEQYGGLIKGMILGSRERKKRAEKAKDRAKQFSFVNGMQTFPEAIAKKLGTKVQCGLEVKRINAAKDTDARKARFSIVVKSDDGEKTIACNILVLAIPSYAASKLIASLDAGLSTMLQSIYYPPVAEVFLGFKKEDVGRMLDGFGYLIPEKEKRNILGTIWSSTIFSDRAPQGFEALTTFVGGSRQPELASLPDAELQRMVMQELQALIQVKGEPVISFINRWQRAIPQYHLGHGNIMNQIEKFEKANLGMFIGGNFRGGISVGDCVMSAHRLSEEIKRLLN